MADTEDPPVLSFKERIAKFNQAKDSVPSPAQPVPAVQPRPRPVRPAPIASKTVNNPPSNGHGSVLDRSGMGNEPDEDENRVGRSGSVPANTSQNGAKPTPPLPSRKTPPVLPRRQSADPSLRRGSVESTASESTTLSTKTMPPPLPSRPQSRASRNENLTVPVPVPAPPPRLPSRQASNNSLSTTASNSGSAAPVPPPRLPPRTPPRTPVPNGDAQPAVPVPKVPDPRQFGFGSKGVPVNGNAQPASSKRDPRQCGFGSSGSPVNGAPVNGNIQPALPRRESSQSRPTPPPPPPRSNGSPVNGDAQPPPIPMASRPDLSKLQATKPRMNAPQATPTPPPAPAASCLKCRDYSYPDAHAARYPRETLPTYDVAWLANELTAPFPYATDKARAIFAWLHHNVAYDVYSFSNNCVKPSTPASTLASGLAVCEGYAGLFAALAKHAGLEAIVISGHGKGAGYTEPAPGSALPPVQSGHAWNAVRLDHGYWKLIDPCWGAGSVNNNSTVYHKDFKPENFTESNDEFGLRHYPSNRDYFFRDDGRPSISWEEYLLGTPQSPISSQRPFIFTDAYKYNLGVRTIQPASRRIPTQSSDPIRFQFNLVCEHWTYEHHSKAPAPVFLLIIGNEGKKEYLPFEQYGGGANGGGDTWLVDVPDARMLGAPGSQLPLAVLTKFGDRENARGVTVEEYKAKRGKVGMAFGFVAQWDLV